MNFLPATYTDCASGNAMVQWVQPFTSHRKFKRMNGIIFRRILSFLCATALLLCPFAEAQRPGGTRPGGGTIRQTTPTRPATPPNLSAAHLISATIPSSIVMSHRHQQERQSSVRTRRSPILPRQTRKQGKPGTVRTTDRRVPQQWSDFSPDPHDKENHLSRISRSLSRMGRKVLRQKRTTDCNIHSLPECRSVAGEILRERTGVQFYPSRSCFFAGQVGRERNGTQNS